MWHSAECVFIGSTKKSIKSPSLLALRQCKGLCLESEHSALKAQHIVLLGARCATGPWFLGAVTLSFPPVTASASRSRVWHRCLL